jgi:hypothetical protein
MAVVLIVVGTLFLSSVFTLSYIQTRLIAAHGWGVFRRRSPRDLYWNSVSNTQRWLLWPGIASFLALLLYLALRSLWVHVRMSGLHG